MTNPYIIERRATDPECWQAIFHRLDAKKLRYLADIAEEAGRPAAAELARSWASEHEMTADRLDGIVPVGAGEVAA